MRRMALGVSALTNTPSRRDASDDGRYAFIAVEGFWIRSFSGTVDVADQQNRLLEERASAAVDH